MCIHKPMKMYKTVELTQCSVVHGTSIYEKFSVVSQNPMLRFLDSTGTKHQKFHGTVILFCYFQKICWYKSIICFFPLYQVLIPLKSQ